MTQVAVITGAGSGIGRAVAVELAEAGYAVVLAGRREDKLRETAAESQGESLPVPTDVADPDSVRALFEQARARYGRIDVLFNNAGLNAPGNVGDVSLEDWRRVIDINLTGSFLCAQEAFKLMRDQNPQGGRIINNGSISAHSPRPGSPAYTASKHAITGLTKSISLDGRPYRIACGQIDIGNAGTEMASRMVNGVPQANGTIAPEPIFDVKHVATAVRQMAALPLDTNIQFMTIMATNMPFVGRG
ncbi:SDR family NAD(P)-dependent oxidoreductase [Kibdelosporangium aridum]|uniref:SDR family NAD(P)-dependent oxidoreductase n=1 Tax=Kibdelosporangium aridum TaxID=2030 RepID=A0A428YKW8_KIBAR|nr:SDR family oxidoreductase [Kibdelosporangium aridum]RSM68285.1 SDR family NAD(P)-dependent oxidoreductase [Kibdelosporangium aridum]